MPSEPGKVWTEPWRSAAVRVVLVGITPCCIAMTVVPAPRAERLIRDVGEVRRTAR
jgi:hypothetical protein